jgi:MerR family transcriptional regulator, light-induced transcriptional regulator
MRAKDTAQQFIPADREADPELIRDFLADAHAALLLNSRPLLASLFRWLRTYHTTRGMSSEDLSGVVQVLADELQRFTATALAEEIPVLASEFSRAQQDNVRRPKRGPEVFQPYLRLLLNHEGVEARNLILEQVAEGKSIRYLHGRILGPAMIEIGRLWLENKITVADEHYATAITETLMNSLHPLVKRHASQKGRVLLIGVQTELHALGIRMVEDFLELDGWDTIYFGPNLPFESIYSAIEKERPNLIAISATTPANLLPTAETIQQIRMMPEARSSPVLVGGYPFLLDHSLFKKVGADAWAANAVHAVRVARSLWKRNGPSFAIPSEGSRISAETSRSRSSWTHRPTPSEELIRLMSELSALHIQLRKRNAIIEELNEEKNRFLGMASHDLRNDVSTATLISRLLGQTREGLSEFQIRLVDRLDAVLKSMLDLIDGFLDVARIEAGKLDIHPEPTDLISLLDDRISVARLFGDEAGVRIFRSGISGPATVNVDPKRINQALNNLLVNAIKFSPQGAEVELAIREEGENYDIDVMDEGPGIPSQQAQRLFSPFTTLGEPGAKGKSGTGLGLHIARRLIEAHGGSIAFRPRNPRGSVFSIALPKVAPPQ